MYLYVTTMNSKEKKMDIFTLSFVSFVVLAHTQTWYSKHILYQVTHVIFNKNKIPFFRM